MTLHDGRMQIPNHPKLFTELKSLEKDAKTGNVDHPSHGSKDIADALAGGVYGLTMRRETWMTHGIPVVSIPASLKEMLTMDNLDKKR